MFKRTVRIREDDPAALQKIAVLQRTQNVVAISRDPSEPVTVIDYYPRTAAQERTRQIQERVERRRPPPVTRALPPSMEDLINAVRTIAPRPSPPEREEEPWSRRSREREEARIPSETKKADGPEVDHEDGEYGRKIDL